MAISLPLWSATVFLPRQTPPTAKPMRRNIIRFGPTRSKPRWRPCAFCCRKARISLAAAPFAQELFKAEQYVDMVLGYLRIGSIHADLSPQEVPLEALVRESVKKVSTLFIHQKSTTLQISSLPGTVLTDKKWFSFVLEQILTNAAKYTPRGTVRVYLAKDSPDTLVVEDTGLGIRAEDLPRIFERGFTGYNGRGGQRSTGLGLYLCHEVLQKLGHTISIRSEPGKGTAVCICFARGTLVVE